MSWHEWMFIVTPLVGVALSGCLPMLRGLMFYGAPRLRGARVMAPTDHERDLGVTWLDQPGLLGRLMGPLGWMFLAFGVMLAVNTMLVVVEQDSRLILSMMAKTLCIGLIPLALVYSKRLFGEWLGSLFNFVQTRADDVSAWFQREARQLYLAPANVVAGLVVGLLILGFEYADQAFVQQSRATWALVIGASLLMTTLAGFALVVMVKGAVLISRVGQFPIYVSSSPYGVLSTGSMLVRIFFVATLVYMVALMTMVLRTWTRPTLPIFIWATSVAALYVAMFVLPQWTIHNRMMTFKRERLLRVEDELQKRLDEFDRQATTETSQLVEALRKRRDELAALPEWPFNWKNFAGILGLAASSTLPMLLKALMSGASIWAPAISNIGRH